MTGHLVLSTLHTTDCVSALSRLTELGVNQEVIATGLAAAIAQRLVRENCPACSEQDFPRPMYLKRLGIAEEGHAQFRHGSGCPACDFTGIRGRSGLYEVMEVNRSIRKALADGKEDVISKAMKATGVQTLVEQAVGRVFDGTMSVAEAYRTCYFGGGRDA